MAVQGLDQGIGFVGRGGLRGSHGGRERERDG